MAGLMIPNPNGESLKNRIIDLLADEKKLSLREIFYNIGKSSSVTYQAVHKAAKELLQKDILEKKQDYYLIKKEWVTELKTFLEKIDNGKNDIIKQLEKNKIANMQFRSTADFGRFALNFFGSIADPANKKEFIINSRHIFNMFFLSKEEHSKFMEAKELFNIYILCDEETETDRIIEKAWEGVGAKIMNGADYCQTCDFMVIDDYVMEIFFNPESKKIWYDFDKATFLTYNLAEVITEINSEKPMHIILIKDPDLAKEIKERTLASFKNQEPKLKSYQPKSLK